jgi:hypothetical protein
LIYCFSIDLYFCLIAFVQISMNIPCITTRLCVQSHPPLIFIIFFLCSGSNDDLDGWEALVARYLAAEIGVPARCVTKDSDFRALSGDSLVALRVCKRLAAHVSSGSGGDGGEDPGLFGEGLVTLSPVFLLDNPVVSAFAHYLSTRVGDPVVTDGLGANVSTVTSSAAPVKAGAKGSGGGGGASGGAKSKAADGGESASATAFANESYLPPVPETAALLAEAAAAGQPSLVAVLLPSVRDEVGSDGERLSELETAALHAAVAACCVACVDVLLTADVSVGGAGVDGVRAVHVAARSGSRQVRCANDLM